MMRDTKTTPEALSALIDGELDGADAAFWAEWLTNDSALAQRWLTYHLIGEALRGELAAPMRDLRSSILARIDAEAAGATLVPLPQRPAANEPRLRWMATAAAVAVVATAGWAVWQMPHETGSETLPPLRQANADLAPSRQEEANPASVDERFYWVAYGNAHGANGTGSLRYARVMAQTRGAH
ncbi:MAG: sigma-E factor negative regulatory protein [Rhodocyclales bacterium]|nr:sigma-E factor negative regulatory protein [Rhodocyclales bacterium]